MTKISKTGYKKNSKDKKEKSLLIPSGRISMENVEGPVWGEDNLGNAAMMFPNQEYLFPGSYVMEKRMFQTGGPIQDQRSWLTEYLNSPKYKERLKKEFPSFSQKQLADQLSQRQSNLKNAKVKVVDTIGKKPGYIFGDHENGNIRIEKGTFGYPNFSTIPIHELGHAVDNGGNLVSEYTKRILKKNLSQNDPYYAAPSEFINRLQPIRYLLDKEGIYDAKSQDFNSEIFDKLQSNPTIKNNVHFQDVMNTLNGKTEEQKKNQFIMMMNSIASNNITSDYPAFMGKGGGLSKFTINYGKSSSPSEAPQGVSMDEYIQEKNSNFFEKVFGGVRKDIIKEEVKNFKKAQMGAQVNLDNPEDPLQPRNPNNFYAGPYGPYQNQEIPSYVPDYTSQYNFPTVESNTGNPFISQPPQQKVEPQPDYFRRNNNIADIGMAGMQTLNKFFNRKQWDEQDRRNQERMGIDQTASSQFGNRGDYDVNSGVFRPNQYTPTQYKKGGTKKYKRGGEYSLSPEEISDLFAQNIDFEIID